MVRAKMTCVEVAHTPGHCRLKFSPVISGSEENKQFFKNTPSGEIVLGVVNPAAAAQFEAGKDYFVDFTPAGG